MTINHFVWAENLIKWRNEVFFASWRQVEPRTDSLIQGTDISIWCSWTQYFEVLLVLSEGIKDGCEMLFHVIIESMDPYESVSMLFRVNSGKSFLPFNINTFHDYNYKANVDQSAFLSAFVDRFRMRLRIWLKSYSAMFNNQWFMDLRSEFIVLVVYV